MPQYQYSPLSQSLSRIRLLRLLPEENNIDAANHEAGDIKCELFEYSLETNSRKNHLYEALSYVWGDPKDLSSINVDGKTLFVTANLHAALLHMRARCLARIIWIDAVCIDQSNNAEKRHQIQLMSKIYGLAQRVVVWLGEAAHESDLAMEMIRVGAGNSREVGSSDEIPEISELAVVKLLHRPWFRRIWVLQEVAAARHISILCGDVEIDGYIFCLGIDSLTFIHENPDLKGLITPVTYLIRGAIFRPKYESKVSGISSLDILSIGSLMDMYHTFKATDRRDKVYALLNMASGDLGTADIWPDYGIIWKDLLERIIHFFLTKTRYVLGEVWSIGGLGSNEQEIEIKFRKRRSWPTISHFTLKSSAKRIQPDDLVCLLQGASKPSIIRLHHDYFEIIVITADLEELAKQDNNSMREESSRSTSNTPIMTVIYESITGFSGEFLLVWDWDEESKPQEDSKEYEKWIKKKDLQSERSFRDFEGPLSKPTRLLNVGFSLISDAKIFESQQGYSYHGIAKLRLAESIKDFERNYAKERSHTLTCMDKFDLIIKELEDDEWRESEQLLKPMIKIRKSIQGENHPDTLRTMSNLVSIYQFSRRPEEAMKLKWMIYLMERKRDKSQITQKEMGYTCGCGIKYLGRGRDYETTLRAKAG